MPVTTYLKIGPNSCVKLKFYINKPSLKFTTIFESAIQSNSTRNHKALIRLQKSRQTIYVSNNQISEILKIFKEDFINTLFVTPLELIKFRGDKDVVKLEFAREGYKLRVHVSLKGLEELRRGFIVGDTSQLLIRRPKETNDSREETGNSPNPLILREDQEMTIPVEKDVIPADQQEETKFIQQYSYRTTRVIFKKTIKIEVLKVPV